VPGVQFHVRDKGGKCSATFVAFGYATSQPTWLRLTDSQRFPDALLDVERIQRSRGCVIGRWDVAASRRLLHVELFGARNTEKSARAERVQPFEAPMVAAMGHGAGPGDGQVLMGQHIDCSQLNRKRQV